MPNFKDQILAVAGDEPILRIVVKNVKENDYASWGEETSQLYIWEEVAPSLDYEYNAGYGGVECHAITAWTESKVIFVGVYDGSSWVTSVPRHPMPHMPHTVGGG